MNKRIRKKREKLRDVSIGGYVYTRKEIMILNKAHIGYMNMRLLYQQIKKPKITRPRMRSLINYIYKNRIKYIKRFRFRFGSGDKYLSYKHLRFARHLNEPDKHTVATPFASNSCEAMSMEVD